MFDHPEDQLLASGPVWHGVAIGWRKDAGLNIQPLQSTNERLVGIKILMPQSSLILISLYAPTSGHDEDFLETISNLSEYLHTNCSQADQVVIGADSNCSTKSSSRRQVAWHNFCEKYSLVIHSSQLPTFHHHNGSSSTFIDVFAASNTLEMGETRQYCTLDTPLNLSSHDPIENNVVIALENSGEETKYTDTYTDFKRQKIIWEPSKIAEYQHLADRALSNAVSYWSTPESIPILSSLLSNLLVKCATLVFDSTTNCKTSVNRPPENIRKAKSALKASFKAWKNAGKPSSKADPLRASYAEARAHLQRLYRYQNNLVNIKHNNYLMQLSR